MNKRSSNPAHKIHEALSLYTVDYEGMGTCIEATFLKQGKRVCVIHSCDPDSNQDVEKFIGWIKKGLGMK
jgi:hypothetical protein